MTTLLDSPPAAANRLGSVSVLMGSNTDYGIFATAQNDAALPDFYGKDFLFLFRATPISAYQQVMRFSSNGTTHYFYIRLDQSGSDLKLFARVVSGGNTDISVAWGANSHPTTNIGDDADGTFRTGCGFMVAFWREGSTYYLAGYDPIHKIMKSSSNTGGLMSANAAASYWVLNGGNLTVGTNFGPPMSGAYLCAVGPDNTAIAGRTGGAFSSNLDELLKIMKDPQRIDDEDWIDTDSIWAPGDLHISGVSQLDTQKTPVHVAADGEETGSEVSDADVTIVCPRTSLSFQASVASGDIMRVMPPYTDPCKNPNQDNYMQDTSGRYNAAGDLLVVPSFGRQEKGNGRGGKDVPTGVISFVDPAKGRRCRWSYPSQIGFVSIDSGDSWVKDTTWSGWCHGAAAYSFDYHLHPSMEIVGDAIYFFPSSHSSLFDFGGGGLVDFDAISTDSHLCAMHVTKIDADLTDPDDTIIEITDLDATRAIAHKLPSPYGLNPLTGSNDNYYHSLTNTYIQTCLDGALISFVWRSRDQTAGKHALCVLDTATDTIESVAFNENASGSFATGIPVGISKIGENLHLWVSNNRVNSYGYHQTQLAVFDTSDFTNTAKHYAFWGGTPLDGTTAGSLGTAAGAMLLGTITSTNKECGFWTDNHGAATTGDCDEVETHDFVTDPSTGRWAMVTKIGLASNGHDAASGEPWDIPPDHVYVTCGTWAVGVGAVVTQQYDILPELVAQGWNETGQRLRLQRTGTGGRAVLTVQTGIGDFTFAGAGGVCDVSGSDAQKATRWGNAFRHIVFDNIFANPSSYAAMSGSPSDGQLTNYHNGAARCVTFGQRYEATTKLIGCGLQEVCYDSTGTLYESLVPYMAVVDYFAADFVDDDEYLAAVGLSADVGDGPTTGFAKPLGQGASIGVASSMGVTL